VFGWDWGDVGVCVEEGWPALLTALPAGFDLEGTARASGAFRRARGIKDAAALLRVALAYGGSDLSLRETSAWAEAAGVAQVSDVALQKRLRHADGWLGQVLQALLAARLAAVDGTGAAEPGPGAGLGRRRCVLLDATSLCEPGADLLVRVGWNSLRLLTPDGAAFDLLAALAAMAGEDGATVRDGEACVRVDEHQPGAASGPVWRLVMHRKTPEQAQVSQDEVRRAAHKRGKTPDPRSLEAARYVILLTSLPREACPAQAVASFYRVRWQVELAFKRWKSLGGLANLQAKNPNLARAWIYARLIVALLAEQACGPGPAFPPLRPRTRSHQPRTRRRAGCPSGRP
jgi:hypothetical protein